MQTVATCHETQQALNIFGCWLASVWKEGLHQKSLILWTQRKPNVMTLKSWVVEEWDVGKSNNALKTKVVFVFLGSIDCSIDYIFQISKGKSQS
jgi:hypothetical protein